MAPDLNTVPDSPHQTRVRLVSQSSSAQNSRRPSQVVHSPVMPQSPVFAHSDQSAMPLRHPRPMTAAELHMELEKEQEAIVNRLTRELSALRAQNSASVASNHSVTSTTSTTPSLLPVDPADPNPTHQITGPTHRTPSRRHRSSSNLSAISGRGTTATAGASTNHVSSVPQPGRSQASADRAAAATRTTLSRNPSMTTSGTSTPARQTDGAGANLTLPHRPSLSQATSFTSQNTSSTHATLGSVASPHPPTSHQPITSIPTSFPLQYGIDADRARSELDAVKVENEALKDRIRALERALRQRRRRESNTSDVSSVSGLTPAANSTNRSPTAPAAGVNVSAWAAGAGSSSAAATEDVGSVVGTQEERDEVVKVGESAGNSGL